MTNSAFGKRVGVLTALLLAGCGGGGGGGGDGGGDGGDGGGGGAGPGGVVGTVKVFAANDLGMHCMDREFATFSILPPYNVVRAQVIRSSASGPVRLDSTQVTVRYAASTDGAGSVNSYSVGKTDFWTHAGALFGATLLPGQGLKGLYMPKDAPVPGPQPFTFSPSMGAWQAEGIPITPVDDLGAVRPYPLLHVAAYDAVTGLELAHTDIDVPVAE